MIVLKKGALYEKEKDKKQNKAKEKLYSQNRSGGVFYFYYGHDSRQQIKIQQSRNELENVNNQLE
ncbi:MAG: hypothetical protein SOT80_06810, partial [Candidatus Pseudoruminococcus sp.]|nr:hypothetical protein [Candidatus Pseudoruminococcus sp.]